MYYVYILLSLKDKKLYAGFSEDLKARIQTHNQGKVSSTKNRRPLKLIFYESYINKHDALRRERYFKTSPGKKSLKIILRETLN